MLCLNNKTHLNLSNSENLIFLWALSQSESLIESLGRGFN